MTLPVSGTVVTYPAGEVISTGRVLHVSSVEPGAYGLNASPQMNAPTGAVHVGAVHAVVLDITACHPVDEAWPDQGADRAVMVHSGIETPVLHCVVGATDGTTLFLGTDIPVSKGTQGWVFVVVHLIEGEPPEEGDVVVVRVDSGYRNAVSAGHTACHLASLALNDAMADRWRKHIAVDALGKPNFDAVAIHQSRIQQNGSVDTYRLGKSLRRKGFIIEPLDVQDIEGRVNARLVEWVSSGADITIALDGEQLTDRRYWVCGLPWGEARIPCGGTHAGSLAQLSGIRVSVSMEDAAGTPLLVMRTAVGDSVRK